MEIRGPINRKKHDSKT